MNDRILMDLFAAFAAVIIERDPACREPLRERIMAVKSTAIEFGWREDRDALVELLSRLPS